MFEKTQVAHARVPTLYLCCQLSPTCSYLYKCTLASFSRVWLTLLTLGFVYNLYEVLALHVSCSLRGKVTFLSCTSTGATLLQERVVKNTCAPSLLVSVIAASLLIHSCNCNRQSDAIFIGAWYNCHIV